MISGIGNSLGNVLRKLAQQKEEKDPQARGIVTASTPGPAQPRNESESQAVSTKPGGPGTGDEDGLGIA